MLLREFSGLQQVELNHQLQAQLLGLREEHQAILQQLKEAHNLIQRHVETSVKLSANKVGATHTFLFRELTRD